MEPETCDQRIDKRMWRQRRRWHAADALMEAAVPDLLITADNPRMTFIRATVACIRPNIGRMLPRGERVRRWRAVGRRRHAKCASPSLDT